MLARKFDAFEKFLAFQAYILTQFGRHKKIYNVIMGESLTMDHFGTFVKFMVCLSIFLALIPHLKMGKLIEKFGLLIICLVLFLLMHLFLLLIGIMHYKWLHIFLIYFQVRFWKVLLLFKFYTNGIPHILTLGCLGVYAILSFPPPHSINYNLDLSPLCFWVTLRIIMATNVMIYLLVKL